ncbi:Uncharacterised protein [Mycobacteroides abscessus]|nr:Uncharacterised protein [Mycobacteroides abscessus]
MSSVPSSCSTCGVRNARVRSGGRSSPPRTAAQNRARSRAVTCAPPSGEPTGGYE